MAENLSKEQIEERLPRIGGWKLNDQGEIFKRSDFKDFKESLKFVNQVGELAEKSNHHPDILIEYNKVTLKLKTHSSDGLTHKDFDLAEAIDRLG